MTILREDQAGTTFFQDRRKSVFSLLGGGRLYKERAFMGGGEMWTPSQGWAAGHPARSRHPSCSPGADKASLRNPARAGETRRAHSLSKEQKGKVLTYLTSFLSRALLPQIFLVVS